MKKIFTFLYITLGILLLSSLVNAYVLTTFSDGTSKGNMTFISSGSFFRNFSIPYWAIINKAEMYLQGYNYDDSHENENQTGYIQVSGTLTTPNNFHDSDYGTYSYIEAPSGFNYVSELYMNYSILGNQNSYSYFYAEAAYCPYVQMNNSLYLYCLNSTANDWLLVDNYTYSNAQHEQFNHSKDLAIECTNSTNKKAQIKVVLQAYNPSVPDVSQYFFYEGKLVALNKSYPSNLNINLNNQAIYQNNSIFNGTSAIDLNKTKMQSCVNIVSSGFANCTLNFTSSTVGILEYSNIDVEYNLSLVAYFVDESSNNLIDGETFNIYFEKSGSTYSYSAATNPYNISNLAEGTYDIKISSSHYPERNYLNTVIFPTSSNKYYFYLTNSTIGEEKTFSVTDSGINPLQDVNINFYRTINGTVTLIAQENTDYNGRAKLYLDSNYEYSINFTKSGYKNKIISLEPTDSDYPVVLESETTEYNRSLDSGIVYSFSPDDSVLQNNTNYNFTFLLNSSYWSLSNCTLYLKNGSSILSQTSGYSLDSCYLTIEYNTDSIKNITTIAKYEIGGYTIFKEKNYMIIYSYEGEFSFKNFIDDLTNFSSAGFNAFTRFIIAIIVIFIIVALVSKEIGYLNPEALIILVDILVLFFCYIKWFYVDYAPMPEISRQYIIFILTSLVAAGFLIDRWGK